MIEITAPASLSRNYPGRKLFLAGGITGCPDWQRQALEHFADFDDELVIFNPRRPQFDVTNPNAAAEQIRWEFEALTVCTHVLFWFCPNEIQPIALYELGRYGSQPHVTGRNVDLEVIQRMIWQQMNGVGTQQRYGDQLAGIRRVFVGRDPAYPRRFDVDIQMQLARPDLPVHRSFDVLLAAVRANLSLELHQAGATEAENRANHERLMRRDCQVGKEVWYVTDNHIGQGVVAERFEEGVMLAEDTSDGRVRKWEVVYMSEKGAKLCLARLKALAARNAAQVGREAPPPANPDPTAGTGSAVPPGHPPPDPPTLGEPPSVEMARPRNGAQVGRHADIVIVDDVVPSTTVPVDVSPIGSEVPPNLPFPSEMNRLGPTEREGQDED